MNCVGFYVCKSCRTACYKKNKVVFPINVAHTVSNQPSGDEVDNDEISDSEKLDPTFKCNEIANSVKIQTATEFLRGLGETPFKKRRVEELSVEDGQKIIAAIKILKLL